MFFFLYIPTPRATNGFVRVAFLHKFGLLRNTELEFNGAILAREGDVFSFADQGLDFLGLFGSKLISRSLEARVDGVLILGVSLIAFFTFIPLVIALFFCVRCKSG